MSAKISMSTVTSLMRDKNHFLSGVTLTSWPGKPVKPQLWQYQSYIHNYIINCWLEIQ